MSDKENNIIYTAKDIEQYLAGKLSPQQMHAMEKAALDDPFLAEAMEGYEAMKVGEWNNQLVALREEITSKGAVAKVIPLHKSKNNWWKAAAAILIIGGGATIAVLFNKNKNEDNPGTETVKTKTTLVDTASLIKNASSESVAKSSTSPTTSEEKKTIPGSIARVDESVKADNKNIAGSNTAPLNPSAPPATTAAAENKNAIAGVPPVNSNAAPGNTNAELSKEMIADNKSRSAAKQNDEADITARRSQVPSKREAVLNNFFTAQVVGTDNTPLPFTNISIKKENFGTYADAKGMVRLVSTDSILQIEVKSVGYQPKTFALRNNQPQTKIILQEDETAFNNKTIITSGNVTSNNRSRRAMLLKDTVVNVEPADGWENYNTYVANNLDIPESNSKGDVHGEVEITFDVKSNGTVSNIRVNKSPGPEYDEAAKRLIQEGPQWRVKKGRKTSASIKVKF